jgi:hypothetical protein
MRRTMSIEEAGEERQRKDMNLGVGRRELELD